MRKFLLLSALFATGWNASVAQHKHQARKTLNALCAPEFYGRGYYQNGAYKASEYIAAKMKQAGLTTLPGAGDWYQNFSFHVNVITDVSLTLNGDNFSTTPKPGADYIINADAGNVTLKGEPILGVLTDSQLSDSTFRANLMLHFQTSRFARRPLYLIDTIAPATRNKCKTLFQTLFGVCNTIELVKEKLTWTVSGEQTESFHIKLQGHAGSDIFSQFSQTKSVTVTIAATLENTQQRNVIGYVKGKEKPDSFIFITAHYDHLGMMGPEAMFAGANDNACGVSMMLDLARYFAHHRQKYSLVFMAFAGEEAGLMGSRFYVKNPLVPLAQIRFLTNLDLVGTGEDGGTVVNATIFKKDYHAFDSLNKKYQYLPSLKPRAKAANSDHYFFSEAGVPAFFLYLAGPRPAYHDVTDLPSTITFAGYKGTFRLIVKFSKYLQQIPAG